MVLLSPIYNILTGLSYIHIIPVFVWLTHIVCVAKTQAKLLTLGSYRFVCFMELSEPMHLCIRGITLHCFPKYWYKKTPPIPSLNFTYNNDLLAKRIIGSGNITFDLWKFKTIWLFIIGNVFFSIMHTLWKKLFMLMSITLSFCQQVDGRFKV